MSNITIAKMISVVTLVKGNCQQVELATKQPFVLVDGQITTLKDAVENALSNTTDFAKAVSTASGLAATKRNGIAKFEKNGSVVEIKFFDGASVVRVDHASTTIELFPAGEQWQAYYHVLMALSNF